MMNNRIVVIPTLIVIIIVCFGVGGYFMANMDGVEETVAIEVDDVGSVTVFPTFGGETLEKTVDYAYNMTYDKLLIDYKSGYISYADLTYNVKRILENSADIKASVIKGMIWQPMVETNSKFHIYVQDDDSGDASTVYFVSAGVPKNKVTMIPYDTQILNIIISDDGKEIRYVTKDKEIPITIEEDWK